MTCECENKGVLSDTLLVDSFSLLLFLSGLAEIKHRAWLPGEGRISVCLEVNYSSPFFQKHTGTVYVVETQVWGMDEDMHNFKMCMVYYLKFYITLPKRNHRKSVSPHYCIDFVAVVLLHIQWGCFFLCSAFFLSERDLSLMREMWLLRSTKSTIFTSFSMSDVRCRLKNFLFLRKCGNSYSIILSA